MAYGEKMLEPSCGTSESLGPIRQAGVLEQLRRNRAKVVEELKEIDATIDIFEKNPAFEECLTQLRRVGINR